MSESPEEITRLLVAYQRGDQAAFDELIEILYHELRRLAQAQLRRSGPGLTLQATGLVHEAYLKLQAHEGGAWEGRRHFFAVAARAMRQLIVDYARRKNRKKRGGGEAPLELDEGRIVIDDQAEIVLAVDEALARLESIEPRLRQIVECRFFAGYTEPETAVALGISERTVQRDWARARAWLREAMR